MKSRKRRPSLARVLRAEAAYRRANASKAKTFSDHMRLARLVCEWARELEELAVAWSPRGGRA